MAIDRDGRIAAAGSTGGTLGKRRGRVGDTPLPGAGFYADSRLGGVACTGWGEGIARLSMARAVLARIESGEDPEAAAVALLDTLHSRLGGSAGLLIATPDARLVSAWSTPRMDPRLGAPGDGVARRRRLTGRGRLGGFGSLAPLGGQRTEQQATNL